MEPCVGAGSSNQESRVGPACNEAATPAADFLPELAEHRGMRCLRGAEAPAATTRKVRLHISSVHVRA